MLIRVMAHRNSLLIRATIYLVVLLFFALKQQEQSLAFLQVALQQDSTFDWSDVDCSNLKAPCGGKKCFFYETSNGLASQAPLNGYLLSQHDFQKQLKSWVWTKQFEEKYKIRHLLLESPRRVNASKEQIECLNSQTYFHANPTEVTPPVFVESRPFTVQKNRAAPNPSLMFGCDVIKKEYMREHLESFLRNLSLAQNAGSSVTDFAHRVQDESARIEQIMEQEPVTSCDFQSFIDTRGNIYWMDVGWDGKIDSFNSSECLGIPVVKWQKRCTRAFAKLRELTQRFVASNHTGE